jgi:hypothetical protein
MNGLSTVVSNNLWEIVICENAGFIVALESVLQTQKAVPEIPGFLRTD